MNRYSETVSDQIATLQTEIERDTATLLALAQTNHVQEERIAALDRALAHADRINEETDQRIAAPEAEVKRLRWALCIYANEDNWSVYHLEEWRDIRTWLGEHDAWKVARAALEPTP